MSLQTRGSVILDRILVVAGLHWHICTGLTDLIISYLLSYNKGLWPG